MHNVTEFGTKNEKYNLKEMPDKNCGNDLLFYNFSCTDYSTSNGRVVGTIDLLKSERVPHLRAFTKKT